MCKRDPARRGDQSQRVSCDHGASGASHRGCSHRPHANVNRSRSGAPTADGDKQLSERGKTADCIDVRCGSPLKPTRACVGSSPGRQAQRLRRSPPVRDRACRTGRAAGQGVGSVKSRPAREMAITDRPTDEHIRGNVDDAPNIAHRQARVCNALRRFASDCAMMSPAS